MNTETIRLWPGTDIPSTLTRHVRPDSIVRPAVLVIPGGGYHFVCESTEGSPIANRFDELGYQTFVLDYRVAPDNPWPATFDDAVRAMRLIRGHGTEWGANPDAIAVCGFSAGGHLAASLATIAPGLSTARAGDAFDDVRATPDAMVLCYPVILSGPKGHAGSRFNLLGTQSPSAEQDALFSLERHVADDTPPAFLWTTVEDTVVPMENSIAFFRAMRERGRVAELHIFPHGQHGMQLGYGRRDIAQWPALADAFLRDTCGFPPAS